MRSSGIYLSMPVLKHVNSVVAKGDEFRSDTAPHESEDDGNGPAPGNGGSTGVTVHRGLVSDGGAPAARSNGTGGRASALGGRGRGFSSVPVPRCTVQYFLINQLNLEIPGFRAVILSLIHSSTTQV